jgi:DNA polymerase-1
MHADLAVPDLDSARIPISLAGMRRALLSRGINLGPSLWALTGGAQPTTDDEIVFVRKPVRWTINSRTHREPAPGQMALF